MSSRGAEATKDLRLLFPPARPPQNLRIADIPATISSLFIVQGEDCAALALGISSDCDSASREELFRTLIGGLTEQERNFG